MQQDSEQSRNSKKVTPSVNRLSKPFVPAMVPIATHLHPTVVSHTIPMIHQNYAQHGAVRPNLSMSISSYGVKPPISIPVSSVGLPISPQMRQQSSSSSSSFISRQLPPIEEPQANPTLKSKFYQKSLSVQNLVEESKNQLENVSASSVLVSSSEEAAKLSFVADSNDYKHAQSMLQRNLNESLLYHPNAKHTSKIMHGSNVSDHIYQEKCKSVDAKVISQRFPNLPKDHLSLSNSLSDRCIENESTIYRDHSWLSDVVSTHDPHFDVVKCHTNLVPIPSHHQLREVVYAHSKSKNNDKTGIKRKKLDVGEITRFTDVAAIPSLKESILHHNSNFSMEMPHLSDIQNSRSFGPRQGMGSSISYGPGQLRKIPIHDRPHLLSSKRNFHGNSYNHPPPLIDVTSNSNRTKSQCSSDSGISSKPIVQVVSKRSSSISKYESYEGMKNSDGVYSESSYENDRDYVGGHNEDLMSDPDYTPIDCSYGLEDSLSNNHRIPGAHQNYISSSSESSGRKRTVKSDTFISRKRRSLMENVRKEIVRNFKLQVNNKCTTQILAKKTSVACQKIIRRDALKSQKLTKEMTSRSKKVIRESCMFWKKFERLEKENRKRIHKQVMEQKQMEIELKEMKRQQRKLNYLITQTELFAHFMSGKQIGTSDTQIDDLKKQTSTGYMPGHAENILASQDEESMRTTERILSSLDSSFENHQMGAGNSIRLAPGTEVEVAGKKFVLAACDDNQESSASDLSLGNAQNQSRLEDEEDYQVVRSRLIENTLEAVKRQRMNISQFSPQNEHCKIDNSSHASSSKPPELSSIEDFQMPSIFQGKLKPYQVNGVMWLAGLYEKGINGILADEMGLGKTVQTIAILSYLAEIQGIWGPFMVVAPASTLHNWQQEISRFVPSFKILPYWGNSYDRKSLRSFWNQNRSATQSREDSPFHVLISSYQLIVRDFKYFQRIRWQYMVLDEAQAIKSSSSQRWKSLLSFNCRNRLLLTGTPIQNNMAELWALLHFIMPTLFDSHQEFNDWFSKDIEAKLESNSIVDQNQLTRLHMILKPFMLRRVKKEVENELSDKIEIDLPCELSYRQRLLYQAIKNKISVDELILLSTTGATSTSSKSVGNPSRGRKNKAISSAQEDELETQGNIFSVPTGSANHLMNIVMQFRKVCNHPELFERKHRYSPLFFNLHPATLSFPKILFESDVGDTDQGNRYRKLFLSKLSIFSPENVFRDFYSSDIYKTHSFAFCLFFPRISINSICNVLLGDMIVRILMYLSDLKQDSTRWSCLKSFCHFSSKSHKKPNSTFWDGVFSRFSRNITNFPNHLRILSLFNNSTSMFSDIPSGFNDYKIVSLKSSSLETPRKRLDSVQNMNHSKNKHSELMDVVDSDFQFTDGNETSKWGHPSEIVVQDSLLYYPRFIQRFVLPAAIAHTTKFSCTSPAALHHQELFHDCSSDNYKFLMTGKFQQNYERTGTASRLFLPNDDISGFYRYYNIYGGNSHVKSLDPMYMVEDSGKIRILDNLLPSLKAEGHRVLIYSQMTRMIDLLEEYLTFRKYRYLRLDGNSKICDRRQMVADFQSNSNIFAFLLSTRAGGLGINLTAADTVIFYDSDWNPTVDQQAMDRAHRLGQTRQVTVYRLICQGTIEEKIQSRARKKSEIQRMVIAGNRFTPGRGFVQNSAGENEVGHEAEDSSSVSGQIKQREVLDLLLDEAEVEEKFRARHAERQAALLDSDGNKKRGRKRKLKLSNVLSEESPDDSKRKLIDFSSQNSTEANNLSTCDGSTITKVAPILQQDHSQPAKTRKPRANTAASGTKKTSKSSTSMNGSAHAATRAALIASSMAAYTSLGYKLIPDPSSNTNLDHNKDSALKNTKTSQNLRNPS